MIAMMNKVGVFVYYNYDLIKLNDGIYLFDSFDEAIDWQYDVLVSNDMAMDVAGGFYLGNDSFHDSKEEVIEAFKGEFDEGIFHVYDIRIMGKVGVCKVGVFVLSDYDELNLMNGVYLFDSIEEAREWQYDILVNSGLAMDASGGFELVNEGHYDSKEDLIEHYQGFTRYMEFFHVYEVHEVHPLVVKSE